ncbi:hypothetical protein [Neobacillus drentensis]
MENWHPVYIFEHILPTMRENGINEKQIDKMLGMNAVSLFAGDSIKVN